MMGAWLVSVYLFVLAGFLGFELINKVPPTLHTPLMSGANAMSGITVVGALTLVAVASLTTSVALGVLALVLATINVVGGFLVTDRMLSTFGGRR
ncbi:NAD(P) transhydrogenase subunit alpha [Egicoccus sp. AB-alg6-2]|uniref:NAD(P) transhydrogenase subunit alpha n=1 Tax=Egicoccus sp. AB-alg6-2 TaxID=3242692 RepID=UPI00359D597A